MCCWNCWTHSMFSIVCSTLADHGCLGLKADDKCVYCIVVWYIKIYRRPLAAHLCRAASSASSGKACGCNFVHIHVESHGCCQFRCWEHWNNQMCFVVGIPAHIGNHDVYYTSLLKALQHICMFIVSFQEMFKDKQTNLSAHMHRVLTLFIWGNLYYWGNYEISKTSAVLVSSQITCINSTVFQAKSACPIEDALLVFSSLSIRIYAGTWD